MGRFFVIYYGTPAYMESMAASSPEEMQEGMKKWMAWADSCGEALIDRGTPLGGGLKVSESGSEPSDKGVLGYSVLEADDMDAAKALLQNYPHIGVPGCEIEVHECHSLPG